MIFTTLDMAESEIADISKALYALKAVPWDSEGSQYAVKGSEKNRFITFEFL